MNRWIHVHMGEKMIGWMDESIWWIKKKEEKSTGGSVSGQVDE